MNNLVIELRYINPLENIDQLTLSNFFICGNPSNGIECLRDLPSIPMNRLALCIRHILPLSE